MPKNCFHIWTNNHVQIKEDMVGTRMKIEKTNILQWCYGYLSADKSGCRQAATAKILTVSLNYSMVIVMSP